MRLQSLTERGLRCSLARSYLTTDTVYNRSSAARSGGRKRPLTWLLRLWLYILSIVKQLLTPEPELKTGDREVTFDQKTRFLNLSSIHTRTTRFPKSLQEGAWWVRIGWGGRQGVRGWSLGEQTRKLSKNRISLTTKTIGRFLPNYALSMCCVETQFFKNLGGRSVI